MKIRKNEKGFTLIELIMVIVILGILASVAIPKFFDLQSDAKEAAEKGAVGGIRSGLQTYYAKHHKFPTALDSASNGACTTTNACFVNILDQGGVTSDWARVSNTVYTGPAGSTFTYTPETGSFL